jgi:hypothetical protein
MDSVRLSRSNIIEMGLLDLSVDLVIRGMLMRRLINSVMSRKIINIAHIVRRSNLSRYSQETIAGLENCG